MITLHEIEREIYGGSGSKVSINRHSTRTYEDQEGNRYILSRCTDADPRYFEAYGPFKKSFQGILPHIKIEGKEYFAEGEPWGEAISLLCETLGAEIIISDPCSGRSCDECEIGGCDHGREVE